MDRPDALTEGRLARISLVLMDIDGTLVSSDRATFDNVLVQLRKLKRLNIRFSVATGRSVAGSQAVLARLREVGMKLAPVVHYNGGVVLHGDDARIIARHTISPELFRIAAELCWAEGLTPVAYACRDGVTEEAHEAVYAQGDSAPIVELNGMAVRRVRDLAAVDDDFVALLVETPSPTAAASLANSLSLRAAGRLRISTSGGCYVEISHPLGTKGRAMETVAHHHGLQLSQIMAIGDNLNDLEMIQAAGFGVAVANAPAAVKSAAAWVCRRAAAEGVVEALRLLVSVRRQDSRRRLAGDSWPKAADLTMEDSETRLLSAS